MISNFNRKLIDYLPAIYHEQKHLGALLAVFEEILYGADATDQYKKRPRQSLEKRIPLVDSIATISFLFDAYETPKDFLPWLASWVALTHFEGLSEQRQRKLVAEIVPMYAFRGTKRYLEKMLGFFKPDNVAITIEDQQLGGFIIGEVEIGKNSRLAHDQPFWFRVQIAPLSDSGDTETTIGEFARHEKTIRRVIDLAKPAYTMYELVWPKGPIKPDTGSSD